MSKYTERNLKNTKIKYDSSVVYSLIRINNYNIVEANGKAYLSIAQCEPVYIQYDHELTCHDVLCDIYNLGMKLESSEANQHNDIIINWCKEHYHPCNIYRLWNAVEFDGDISYIDEVFLSSKNNLIDIEKLIESIGKIYRATDTYFALYAVLQGDDEKIYNISKKKGLFPPITMFERFKNPNTKTVLKEGITSEQITAFKAKPEVYQDFSQDEIYEEIPIDEFGYKINNLNETLQEYKKSKEFIISPDTKIDELFNEFLQSLPSYNLTLRYDATLGKARFTPIVNDIFDIGFYALAEKVTTDADYQFGQSKIYYNKVYSTCIYCGSLFIKTGKNQKCCLSKECLKINANERKRRSRAKQNTTNPIKD